MAKTEKGHGNRVIEIVFNDFLKNNFLDLGYNTVYDLDGSIQWQTRGSDLSFTYIKSKLESFAQWHS